MDARSLIGILLIAVIYFTFLAGPPSTPPPPAATNTIAPSMGGIAPSAIPDPSPASITRSKLSEEVTVLENDLVGIELDRLGGVRELKFKKYRENFKTDEVVETDFRGSFSDLRIRTSEGIPSWTLASKESDGWILSANIGKLSLTRSIRILPDTYQLEIIDRIANNGSQTVEVESEARLSHPGRNFVQSAGFFQRLLKPQASIQSAVVMDDGSVSRYLIDQVGNEVFNKMVTWGGFAHRYFFFGLIPQNISVTEFRIRDEGGERVIEEMKFQPKRLAPQEDSEVRYSLYLGPKEMPELAKASKDLPRVVDYGNWIGPIARFLLSILHFFYSLIPNYGIAIILLTLLVKATLFPLAFKAALSMRKLALVQPKMKEIQAKYKNDKHRLQSEMMALYRTEKVNPVGGCLPLLLQMPVFFALYRVFFASIELRHAPFFGWIQDLSDYDPYFVTPVLMTALMWFQQKITPLPPTADDNDFLRAQMTMMKWMPILFGLIMVFLPSGLTLYFLVNAGVSIIQQYYLNKYLEKRFPLPHQQPRLAASGK